MTKPSMSLYLKKDSPPVAQPQTPVNDVAPGSREHFSVLMRDHHRELLVYTRSIVNNHHAAQDIVQDAFITAYKKFATFDHSLDFGKWMRGIVRNKSLKWFRKNKQLPLADSDIVELELDAEAWQNCRETDDISLLEALHDCVGRLPDRLRSAVTACYFDEQSGTSAAKALEVSTATVRKRLERAREQLHNCLERKLNQL